MKKRLLSLLGSSGRSKNFFCLNHEKIEYLKINEYCESCQIEFCYLCGNKHIDKMCTVNWGSELSLIIKKSATSENSRFNLGYPFVLNLLTLKCPCGTEFLSSENSSFCSACSNPTCSAECHKKYCEDEGYCNFKINFLESLETQQFNGMRLIDIKSLIKSIEEEFPPFARNSISNSKFMASLVGNDPFTIILQRGFRQYGQPRPEMLNSMKELTSEEGNKLYNEFSTKLCVCTCSYCSNKSPHPQYNCNSGCESTEQLAENEKLQLKLYSKCFCACNFCALQPNHTMELCMHQCESYKFKRF